MPAPVREMSEAIVPSGAKGKRGESHIGERAIGEASVDGLRVREACVGGLRVGEAWADEAGSPGCL